MKASKKSNKPISIPVFIACILSLLCALVVLTVSIYQNVNYRPSYSGTWLLLILCVVSLSSLAILLLLILRQARIAENEMLNRLNTMKAMFFQDMSHDLKTPLTVISVNIIDSLHMLDYDINIADLRENLDNAQTEVMRMSRMVDSTIKQTIAQGSRYDTEPLDLAELLLEGAEPYRTLLKRNNNTLYLEIPETLPEIIGNADMILLVLSNLLSNATRYTQNGKITISADFDDDNVTVYVKDTGTGMATKILPNAFNRGVSDGGTGLGLSICKSILDVHNGEIGIESIEDEGTTVYFSIPIKETK